MQIPATALQSRTVAAELQERVQDAEKGPKFLVNLKQKLQEFKAAAQEDMKQLESSRGKWDMDSTTTPGGKSDRAKPKRKHEPSESDDHYIPDENESDSYESQRTWTLDEAGEKQRRRKAKLEKLEQEWGVKRVLF